MTEASSGKPGSSEKLSHRPGEIVIGITTSPNGNRCVGMAYDGEEWLLLTSQTSALAHNLRRQLKRDFGAEAVLGLAVDWKESLGNNKTILIDDPNRIPVNGIYVKPEDFDRLVATLGNL